MGLKSPATGMEIARAGRSSGRDPEGPGGENHRPRGPRPANPDFDIATDGPTTRHGIPFDNVIHAVDDLGWRADEVNHFHKTNGTLLAIPEGEWTVDRNVFYGTQNWGIVGLGPDVTLKPPKGRCVRMIQVSGNDPGKNLLIENIEFDQRSGMEAGIGLTINVSDGLEIHHSERSGMTPNRLTAGPPLGQEPTGIQAAVTTKSGRATISHWTDHSETEVIDYPGNGAGMMFPVSSVGTVRIEDSSIKYQGEHACYASKAWQVEIVRCEFVDCANTNIRLAGEGSFAKDSIFGFERDASYTVHVGPKPGKKATKILRAENELLGESGGYFENCHFFSRAEGLAGSYLLYIMGSVGAMEFRDSLIENQVDDDGAVIEPIGSGWRHKIPPGEDWIRFVGCRFEGYSEFPPIESYRPGLVYARNCTCDMPRAPKAKGLARHGIEYLS